jgi:predicted Zn-dependent peptidase
MAERLDKRILDNGMVVLGEPIENIGSVAFVFLVPSGAATLRDGCCGAASVITDWLFRGAGDRNSRQLIDALDCLGLHCASSVTSSHISLGAALEASNLANALELYADIVLRPMLDAEQFELSRQLAIQSLMGLDDDPRQKVMLNLREKFYPTPLGRSPVGKLGELENLGAAETTAIVKENFYLPETIFAVAGKYDFDTVCTQLEEMFNIAQARDHRPITLGKRGGRYTHEQHDGAQVHIGLMTPTVTIASADYYNAMAAVSVLSGGMSGRLFTEVREKRGLCYAVGARYHTLKEFAGISCYAGTTPAKAQETLDVITAEFNRLCEGISEDEMQRAKVGLKSSLIMQSESSGARAGGIASDYYLLGRVRPLKEIKSKLDATSVDSVLGFLGANKFADYTVVTIGPKQVEHEQAGHSS